MRLLPLLALFACQTDTGQAGAWVITLDRDAGTFDLLHSVTGEGLEDVAIAIGTGSAEVEMSFGSFHFDDETLDLTPVAGFGRIWGGDEVQLLVELEDADGASLGELVLSPSAEGHVLFDLSTDVGTDRIQLSASCHADEHFLGLGSHAMDVDHVGEAFPVWVSEPGIGKSETDDYPDDWFLTGTRHASSFPMPWLLRPQLDQGWLIDSTGRLEVDLCSSDPERWQLTVWDGPQLSTVLIAEDSPLEVVEGLTRYTGRPELPEGWVFAPWNDAVRGAERVREVADQLREAGAPGTVIWSEDWKGAEETAAGYHLTGEWFLDEVLYPDAEAFAAELEADGYKWFAYFSPFVETGTTTWDEAVEAGVLIEDETGAPYTFTGATFTDTSMVDLTSTAGVAFVEARMDAALDHGFDGWMADYAEWLPTDADLVGGDGWEWHNAFPLLWQQINQDVMEGRDASFFVRSGWAGTSGLAPVVWAGDQRTSFDTDDGFPTVLPLGLGLSASGVPVYTHDIAGYQSIGNDPSTQELWFRWAWLGAFSPVMRTHHGAFDEDNHQFDSTPETLAHWVTTTREHMRLFPYRYALAAQAAEQGTPMVLPISFVYEDDWDRIDAWLLGEALLVAPVLEEGATSRSVALPDEVQWYDWFTLEPVESGTFTAEVDEIPVFAAGGTTVPTFDLIPDSLVDDLSDEWIGWSEADGSRTVYLFGGGGLFTEADGTTYTPSGTADAPAQVTETLTAGSVSVGGVTVQVEGDVERAYTFVVVP